MYKILYQAVNAGRAVYKILLEVLRYPDVVYKVATAAILIQTRGEQSVLSLEKSFARQMIKLDYEHSITSKLCTGLFIRLFEYRVFAKIGESQ